jgi:2-C-methyl-D-erythritol 4-phosphate cytidylyltransferase
MGTRLGEAVPKGLIDLLGRPLFAYSLDTMAASRAIDGVVLVAPSSELERARTLAAGVKVGALVRDVIAGGSSRDDSVRLGLAAVPSDCDVVVCHDAARPFATASLFVRAVDALAGADGVVPVVPSSDTVKRIEGRRIVATVPRSDVVLAQTPQVFRLDCLRSAHDRHARSSDSEPTDDAMLLEQAGFHVVTVEGEPSNFKITTPDDFRRAEIMVRGYE